MIRIALTLLVGDRTKFFGIIFGLSFATLLITQQAAIFRGVMVLVYGPVTDTPQAELWICDPGAPDMDTNAMLHERELDHVRGIAGVRWAAPLARRQLIARKADLELVPMMVMGIDDATLIGAPLPGALISGDIASLRRADSVIIDSHAAASKLRLPVEGGGHRPMGIGDHLLINGRKITVVGICHATLSLMLTPTGYMLRSQAVALDPSVDGGFNFILAGIDDGADPGVICANIANATGLAARTSAEFSQHIYDFFLYKTGIPANFAIAVLLGFVVGGAISGQTFHQFVTDNRRVFAALKAMGMSNLTLAGILTAQAIAAAVIGYGIGIGGAVVFGWMLDGTDLSFRLEPALLVFALISVLLLSLGAAMAGLRSVVRLDPALVFRS